MPTLLEDRKKMIFIDMVHFELAHGYVLLD